VTVRSRGTTGTGDRVRDIAPIALGDATAHAAWAGLAAGLLAATRGEAPSQRELPALGLATFALTRALATERAGPWGALGLVGLRVARPREGRLLVSVLAAAGLNDALQAAFARLAGRTAAAPRDARRPPPRFTRTTAP
jgi:hypothetical protein